MKTYDLSCFDKSELVRLFLYKTFNNLMNYEINDIKIISSSISRSISEYDSISELSKNIIKLDINSLMISNKFGNYCIDIKSIDSFTIFDDFVELVTKDKKYIFCRG